ncbi:CIA30 family protein [Thermostichus vulcanus]|uniref:CIA30 family protein n=1 Tax=Thermostichus vulcanus str. 'Rupite' TaxID=2813851 RepID=A0ABT0C9A3_THEVL|nr:CIA30 family protein [Thermostichus vulcanus]MCJ2542336.1 CIA30 family protein [Thermostichus vulcanus str. 'Rupite']
MSWDLGRFWNTLTYYDALPFAEAWRWVHNGFQPKSSVNPVPPILSGSLPAQALLLGRGLPTGLAEALKQQGVEVWDSSQDLAQGLAAATVFLGLEDAELAQTHLDQIRHSGRTEQMLFDFRQPNPDLGEFWGILDDVVMGGVSQSQLLWGEGELLFTGQVSTANSGGFVSTRTRNLEPPLDLSGFAGLELRLRGDGQRYKFFLRDQTGWDSPAFSCAFDTRPARVSGTESSAEQTVRIPFAEMVPTFRARLLPNAPPLNSSRICSLQLMLSKFEADGSLNPRFRPGSFQLGLRWIGAYRRDPLPQIIGVVRDRIPEGLLALMQVGSSRWCGVEAAADMEESILVTQLLQLMQSPQSVGQVERVEQFHA